MILDIVIDKDSRYMGECMLPANLLLKLCPRTGKFLPYVSYSGVGPDARLQFEINIRDRDGNPCDTQALAEIVNLFWQPTVLGVTADGSKVMRR